MVDQYPLPLTLAPVEGPALTPIAQLDSEASSVSSDRDSAFPLDSEGRSLYFERDGEYSPVSYSEMEGMPVYSERELVAPVLDSVTNLGGFSVEVARGVYSERDLSERPVLDSEADSGTGSVCEEEADDAPDQVRFNNLLVWQKCHRNDG